MANYFGGDPNCVALWRFESGDFLTDSIGSNDLTNNNGVENNTSTYYEGSASARFDGDLSQSLSIADASLDAGFPFKNGDATKTGSFSFWFRPMVLPGSGNWDCFVGKGTTNKWSIWFGIQNSSLAVSWGYNTGISQQDWTAIKTLTIGRVYHVGIRIDGISKTANIRLWDVTASTAYSYDYTFSNELNVEDAAFSIGAKSSVVDFFNGYIDEFVVFNDLVTDDEFDAIRNGLYGAGMVGISTVDQPTCLAELANKPVFCTGSFEITGTATYYESQDVVCDESLTSPTLTCSIDRGRLFSVDADLSVPVLNSRLDERLAVSGSLYNPTLVSYLAGGLVQDMPDIVFSGTLLRGPAFEVGSELPLVTFSSTLKKWPALYSSSTLEDITSTALLVRSALVTEYSKVANPSLSSSIKQNVVLSLSGTLTAPSFSSNVVRHSVVSASSSISKPTLSAVSKQGIFLSSTGRLSNPSLSAVFSRNALVSTSKSLPVPHFSGTLKRTALMVGALSIRTASVVSSGTLLRNVALTASCAVTSPDVDVAQLETATSRFTNKILGWRRWDYTTAQVDSDIQTIELEATIS